MPNLLQVILTSKTGQGSTELKSEVLKAFQPSNHLSSIEIQFQHAALAGLSRGVCHSSTTQNLAAKEKVPDFNRSRIITSPLQILESKTR